MHITNMYHGGSPKSPSRTFLVEYEMNNLPHSVSIRVGFHAHVFGSLKRRAVCGFVSLPRIYFESFPTER